MPEKLLFAFTVVWLCLSHKCSLDTPCSFQLPSTKLLSISPWYLPSLSATSAGCFLAEGHSEHHVIFVPLPFSISERAGTHCWARSDPRWRPWLGTLPVCLWEGRFETESSLFQLKVFYFKIKLLLKHSWISETAFSLVSFYSMGKAKRCLYQPLIF